MKDRGNIVMVSAYAHKGITNMERVNIDDKGTFEEAAVYTRTIHPKLGECLVGRFLTGIGAFNVHFPIDAVRVATNPEKKMLMRGRYVGCGTVYRLVPGDFVEDLDGAFRIFIDHDKL